MGHGQHIADTLMDTGKLELAALEFCWHMLVNLPVRQAAAH